MKTEPPVRPTRVGLVSLGCAKNLVDSEIMLGCLLKGGIEIINDPAGADAIIVNTCSFIDAAQEESVDTILESAAVREAQNRGQALIVSGCLPQRFREELPRLFPEVDAFMGIDQVAQVETVVREALARRAQRLAGGESRRNQTSRKRVSVRLAELDRSRAEADEAPSESLRGSEKFGRTKTVVAPGRPGAGGGTGETHGVSAGSGQWLDVSLRPRFIPDFATPRYRLTPAHLAYVKIAEGCNHPCSFCIIPRIRGSHRSRPQADVVREARQLLAEGVKELNLISQDTTYYGMDLAPTRQRAPSAAGRFEAAARALPADATTLCTLLRELNDLPGDFWIRLLYTHPAHWTEEVIQTMAACPKVARYVDMPLQHIHPLMLERMRRETSAEHIRQLIGRLRSALPGIALRTTFIVGFPGESDAAFEALLDFIRETRFERLGVFTYSREEGTRAARMENQVPVRVRSKRRDLAMAAQHEVARAVSESFVGRTLNVLVEGRASAEQLSRANVYSWEHGLVREAAPTGPDLGARHYLVARGEADAPDIDGRVYLRGRLPVGDFARVKIVGHTDYDLIAEPA